MSKILKKILCQLDLFAVAPLLRSKSQPMVGSFLLGLFSVVLFSLFVWIFVGNVINSLNLDSSQIAFSNSILKKFDPKDITNIMFGISFASLNEQGLQIQKVQDFKTYFQMSAFQLNKQKKNFFPIELSPCQAQQWSLLGDDFQNLFNKYELRKFYCPPELLNFKNMSNNDLFLFVALQPCSGYPYCKNASIIQKAYNNIMKKYSSFPIYFNILNPVAQVTSSQPLTYTIQPKQYFSSGMSQIVFVQFNQLVINTQKSIIPFTSISEKTGGFVISQQTFYAFSQIENINDVNNNLLFGFNGFLSSNIITYDRSVNQIDQMISYVGGLLGIVLIFLSFFLSKQAQYRYEIRLAEASVNYDEDGYKINQEDLTFWIYIKYSIYSWVSFLCCYELSWQKIKEFDQTREVGSQMLGVQNLYRRLDFLQRVIQKQSNHNLFLCMTLIEPDHIYEVKKKRNILQYYQKVVKMNKAATVEDAIREDAISFKYLGDQYSKIKKKNLKNNEQKNENISGRQLWQPKITNDQNEQQIKNSLRDDLDLEHMDRACELISHYPLIVKQAKQVKLKNQYLEVEKQMASAFLNLTPQQKKQHIMKIPIIILHRLRFRSREIKKQKYMKNILEQKTTNQDGLLRRSKRQRYSIL